MAKNDFDSVEEFLSEFKNDFIDVVNNEVDETVKDVYEGQVDYMYEEYNRTYYNPRYKNGGFADRSNWQSEIKADNNSIVYTMENITETNGDDSGRLDQYIEKGIYGWKRHPQSRPIYERAQEILDTTAHIEMAIDDGLIRKGYK